MKNKMEEQKKFYSQRSIALATFFGGPLAAGVLIRKNYLTLYMEKQGMYALFIGIAATLLLFVAIFSLPESVVDKLGSVLPFVYTAIIYGIVETIHGKELKLHKENKGEFYSGWRAAGIGFLSMLVILVGIFAYAFSLEEDFDADTYDKEITTFIENEEQALKAFDRIETGSHEFLIGEFSKGLVLWKENKAIVEKVSVIENLPSELQIQNKLLQEYSELRIDQYELFLNAISEDTDKYYSQIESKRIEIEQILDELNQ